MNDLNDQKVIDELVDTACLAIDEHIMANLALLNKPECHTLLNDMVFDDLRVQFENIYDEKIEEIIHGVISVANRIYFTNIMPRRSYKTTFTKELTEEKRQELGSKIEYLRNLPQPEQRTPAWYEYRQNLLTASNAWKAFSSPSNSNSLIYEKCKPYDSTKFDNVNIDSPFHWGTKYEELSVMVYEDMYNTKVEDFGCIQDKTHKFLGASPDGINVDPTSARYGRMLEIKNRYSESVPISGNPKYEYWIQMQLQMNVCELNECDFLETRFIEYENKDDYDADGTFTETHDGKRKGIYFCMLDKKNKPVYFYPPLKSLDSFESYQKWESETLEKNQDKQWFTTYYWKLEKLSCVLVLRNTYWFEMATHILGEVWKTIEKERIEGYEHRAPNRRGKTNTITVCKLSNTSGNSGVSETKKTNIDKFFKKESGTGPGPTEKKGNCLIDFNTLFGN